MRQILVAVLFLGCAAKPVADLTSARLENLNARVQTLEFVAGKMICERKCAAEPDVEHFSFHPDYGCKCLTADDMLQIQEGRLSDGGTP